MGDPPEPTGGEKGVRGSQGIEAEEEDRERYCRMKDEMERLHWVVSIKMLMLAFVNDALWDSAYALDKKALWKNVFLWVTGRVVFRESPKEDEVLERFGLGGETDDGGASAPLKGALCTLSAALMHLHNCDPSLSQPQHERKPPLPAQTQLQECVRLCEALCGLRRKLSERLRVGGPGDLPDLEEELGKQRQRCENLTNEVLGTRGAGDKRGALEEEAAVLTQTQSAADASCDPSSEPQRTSSSFQGFVKSALFWRMTTLLFFCLSVTGFTLLFVCLSCHTPPSSRIQTSHGRDDWMPSMNKYFWNQEETSWDISSRLCLENGGRLAVLHDELKMDEIFKEFGRRYPWIGLSKSDEEFQWIDGFPFNANMTPVRGFGECAYLRKDGIFLNECIMRRSSLCRRESYG